MSPNVIGNNFLLAESVIKKSNGDRPSNPSKIRTANASSPIAENNERAQRNDEGMKQNNIEIVWRNIIAFIVLHSSALYGLYVALAEFSILDLLFFLFLATVGAMGITAGAHRLWSHRAYKARLPLRIFLMLCNSLSFQNSIYEWTRDHRVHHKFTDTDADPHNSKRGFFFAHMGWLLCRKHPDVKLKGKSIDLSDLEADPVVMFQRKYYLILMPLCCFVVPTLIPYMCWSSPFRRAFFFCGMLRYCLSLHATWLVNSAAHFYGMKPYDKTISSVNTKFVAFFTYGEGWHNYHHVFPWDYKAAELGNYYNGTTAFLNFAAKLGLAYDLKTVTKEMILKRIQRTGDGSHPLLLNQDNDENNNLATTANQNTPIDHLVTQLDHEKEKTFVWGWNDADISEEDRKGVEILQKPKA